MEPPPAPMVLISIIGFVESVSVAQTLAAKRRQRIDPDQELIGLGMANMGAGMTGGYPVTGGFARSVVNFDAGARTPAAGAFTAIGLAIASLTITPFIAFLPQATLAATIIVAVLSLVDFSIFRTAWVYSKADFVAVAATVLVTLVIGVEAGVTAGVLLSVLIHLYKTSKPHMAVIGQVPGTEHYRNVKRHEVITDPHILQLRVDESLYFANARYLEDKLYAMVADHPELKHVVLACPAVNAIDMSALESLEAINERLEALGVKRVTLPRMLPAAALMAMENALTILKGAMESGEVADHPDLLYGIDDIWALMGQPEIKAMEQRYADLDAIALPEDRAAS